MSRLNVRAAGVFSIGGRPRPEGQSLPSLSTVKQSHTTRWNGAIDPGVVPSGSFHAVDVGWSIIKPIRRGVRRGPENSFRNDAAIGFHDYGADGRIYNKPR